MEKAVAEKKPTKEQIFNRERDLLRSKNDTTLIVNGHEVKVSDYYKDPAKYNKMKLDPAYVKQIEEHYHRSVQAKEKLQVDPSTIKSIL